MSKLDLLTAVFLHDVNHGNIDVVRRKAGLPTPMSIRSFTDTFDADGGKYAESLRREVFFKADYLFLQEELVQNEAMTELAKIAVGSAMFTSARRADIYTFDMSYEPSKLSLESLFVGLEGVES